MLQKQKKKKKKDGAVDQNIIIRWFKKFHLGCKNTDGQTSLG